MTNEEFKPVTINAVEGDINAADERIRLYTAEVPAEVVAHFYVENAVSMSGGFQRSLDTNRAAKIGRLQGGDKTRHIEPTPNVHGGLLAYADDGEVKFEKGKLTINKPLRLIDGQHRAGGARWAVQNGQTADYTETVRVVVGATKRELAMWYLRCNLEARKVAPANILLNIAAMEGIVLRKKTWIARLVVALSAQEPFLVDDERLVSFTTRDGGRIAAQTLYRATDLLLPEKLNREGDKIEVEAITYAWRAFNIYANMIEGWGAKDDKDGFAQNPAYSFTTMVAYAHFYGAINAADMEDDEIEELVRKGFDMANLPEVGSGEKAAVALASYAAGQADVPLARIAA